MTAADEPARLPRPLAAGHALYAGRRDAGDDEHTALDAALREALRVAGRPLPGTPRPTPDTPA